ncbi:hypothetical protein AAZX31_02G020000 [Glycine max]
MEDFHKEFQEKNSDVKSRFDIGNASGKKWISMINEADILIMATDIFTDTKKKKIVWCFIEPWTPSTTTTTFCGYGIFNLFSAA